MRNILSFHYYIKPISSIVLDYDAIIFRNAWDTQQLTATISPSDAQDKTLIWSSSNTSIATVSQTGLVTCVTPGSCTITCAARHWSASVTCDVVQAIPVTMTSTTCRWWSPNGDTQDALFTAQRTWYYHITWQWYNQTSNWSTVIWISWWTNISWTDYVYTTNYETSNIDCIREITAWTVVYWNWQRWSSGIWWWRNFAAEYYWSYNPSSWWWGGAQGSAVK